MPKGKALTFGGASNFNPHLYYKGSPKGESILATLDMARCVCGATRVFDTGPESRDDGCERCGRKL